MRSKLVIFKAGLDKVGEMHMALPKCNYFGNYFIGTPEDFQKGKTMNKPRFQHFM